MHHFRAAMAADHNRPRSPFMSAARSSPARSRVDTARRPDFQQWSDQVSGAVSQTLDHAAEMLKRSEAVVATAAKLRKNVDNFLHRVAV